VQQIVVEGGADVVSQIEVYDKQQYLSAVQKEADIASAPMPIDMSNVKVTKMGDACDPNDLSCEACQ
jgi:cobalamin-dependent methionine synthase I